MSYETISNKLGIPVTSLSTIKVEKNSSNRVDKIIIDNHVYGGVEFRTKLGLRNFLVVSHNIDFHKSRKKQL